VGHKLPSNASEEYQHSSLGTYFTDQGWTDGGTANLTDVGMHGFLYVGGDISNSGGNSSFVGAIYVGGDISVNALTMYYDFSVADGVEFSDSQINRVSWDKVLATW